MSHIIRDSSVVVQTPSFSTRSMGTQPTRVFPSLLLSAHLLRHSAEHREEGCPRWRVCPSLAPRARRLSPRRLSPSSTRRARVDSQTPPSLRACVRPVASPVSDREARPGRARLGVEDGDRGPRSGRRGVHPSAHISPCPRRHPYSPTPPRPVQADRGASRADIQLTHRLAPRSRPFT